MDPTTLNHLLTSLTEKKNITRSKRSYSRTLLPTEKVFNTWSNGRATWTRKILGSLQCKWNMRQNLSSNFIPSSPRLPDPRASDRCRRSRILKRGCCHEPWLRNLGGTWPWEGHMTKPGLTRHVTRHMTSHVIRRLSLRLTSHVTRNKNMTWCTLTSVDVIFVTSTTDTRTRRTTKSSEIGSALTPTRVNATQS